MGANENDQSNGVSSLPAVGVHSHLCCFYGSHAEMERLWIPFLITGLKQHEKCLLLVGDDYAVDVAAAALKAVDASAYVKGVSSGQLAIVTNEGFPTSLQVTAEEIIAFWRARLEVACEEGYASIRVAAQMTWLPEARRNADVVPIYEFLANEIFPQLPVSAICMYDKNIFNASQQERVVAVHPLVGHVDHTGNAVFGSAREFVTQQAIDAGKFAREWDPRINQMLADAAALMKDKHFAGAEDLYQRVVDSAETDLAKVSALLGLVQTLRAQDKIAEASTAADTATSLLLTAGRAKSKCDRSAS